VIKTHVSIRRADDTDEFALLPLGTAGNAGSHREASRRECMRGSGRVR
jgi:hypothetical protein